MSRRRGDGVRRSVALVAAVSIALGAVVSGAAIGVVAAETTSVSIANEGGERTIEGSINDTHTMTVRANASSVSAYQATLTFDPGVIEITSISGTDDFEDPVADVDNERGQVRFNQYRDSEVDDPRFATLTVEFVGSGGEETSLSFVEEETKLSDSSAEEVAIEDYESATIAASLAESSSNEIIGGTSTETSTPGFGAVATVVSVALFGYLRYRRG